MNMVSFFASYPGHTSDFAELDAHSIHFICLGMRIFKFSHLHRPKDFNVWLLDRGALGARKFA